MQAGTSLQNALLIVKKLNSHTFLIVTLSKNNRCYNICLRVKSLQFEAFAQILIVVGENELEFGLVLGFWCDSDDLVLEWKIFGFRIFKDFGEA